MAIRPGPGPRSKGGFFSTCIKNTVDGRNPANHLGWLNPINNGIIIILGGAGFCPSTVPSVKGIKFE